MSVKVFAYGSNLCVERLAARISRVSPVATGYVEGYRLAFHKRSRDGSGKADAFFTGDVRDRVWGAVYDLLDHDKSILDGFEGLGVDYGEAQVSVYGPGDPEIQARVYVATEHTIDPDARPYHWYHRFVTVGACQHGLPPDYVASIEAVETIVDVDVNRTTRELSVLRKKD